jgi:UDP-N-acetylglucosamine 2-epimerase (non-hydrolysing)
VINLVVGTRPEVIKLFPVYQMLRDLREPVRFLWTMQQEKPVRELFKLFDVDPKDIVTLMHRPSGHESHPIAVGFYATSIMEYLDDGMDHCIVVQGDTNTALAGAFAGYHCKHFVFHVEAGMRSHNLYQPYPEEMNRILISKMTNCHFAPSDIEYGNLTNVNGTVHVVGNTCIDAAKWAVIYGDEPDDLLKPEPGVKTILATGHRHENRRTQIDQVIATLQRVVAQRQDVRVFWIRHPNPMVPTPKGVGARFKTISPIPYDKLMHLLKDSIDLVVTDSGGLQEECNYFGVKTVVCREETERKSLLAGGFGTVLADSTVDLYDTIVTMLDRVVSVANNHVYGSGDASEKIVKVIREYGTWDGPSV